MSAGKKFLIAFGILIGVILMSACIFLAIVFHGLKTVDFSHTDSDLGISSGSIWYTPSTPEDTSSVSKTESSKPESRPDSSRPENSSEQESSGTGESQNSSEESVPERVYVNPDDYINIVFFGLSGEEGYDAFRSDSIIICTIDKAHHTLKFTSILRDSKVPIEGYRPQKINAAYRYGGAYLALKTLNQNFGLALRDYITVDFDDMGAVVDYIGGVGINLSQREADVINSAHGSHLSAGYNVLNGKQTVTYCRIRSLDSDVVRSERQKAVLTSIFNRFKGLGVGDKIAFGSQFLYLVETSLSYGDIVNLASIPIDQYTVVTNTVPDQNRDRNVWGGIDSYGEWVWTFDLAYAAARLHNIIYG